ncbi:MAG: arginine repressor [Spirochaetia bacterium]
MVKERTQRLRAIKRIIKERRIDSQETLLAHLQNEGYVVTQATLSRDLKLLKVSKVSQGEEGYFYTMPTEEQRREAERNYVNDFLRGYVSMDFSGNLCVIRTLSGHADSVAIALDSFGLEEVLGTVAGDDTVLTILREGCNAQEWEQRLAEMIPELKA